MMESGTSLIVSRKSWSMAISLLIGDKKETALFLVGQNWLVARRMKFLIVITPSKNLAQELLRAFQVGAIQK